MNKILVLFVIAMPLFGQQKHLLEVHHCVTGNCEVNQIPCGTREDHCWEQIGPMIKSKDSTVVKLSDEEYAHLQQLRQAVVAEERWLAVKYGAEVGQFHICKREELPNLSSFTDIFCSSNTIDHYEFHGIFLLIDKGAK